MSKQYYEVWDDGTMKERSDLHEIPRDGSYVCFFDTDDGFHEETWYKNNECHKLNGPAYVVDKSDGYHYEAWFQDGGLYRLDGPAIIIDKSDGIIVFKWFNNGWKIQINEEKYEQFKQEYLEQKQLKEWQEFGHAKSA